MSDTLTFTKLAKIDSIRLTPSQSIDQSGSSSKRIGRTQLRPVSDEERVNSAHESDDPFQFKTALKTDAQLAEIRHRGRKGKQVEQYQREQNELISQLLKPLEQHTSDAKEAEDAAKLPVRIAVLASLCANAALCILQIYATVASGSLSILAAGVDSVFDIGANVILGWFHRKAARLDANKWPVGGARLQTIGNITYGSLMAAVNLVVIVECCRDLITSNGDIKFHLIPLIAVGVALGVKLALFLYCFALRNSSSQVRMLWEDHRNDLFVNTFAILMSAGGSKLRWWLDPLGGLLIAAAIIFSWIKTVYGQFELLAGRSAPHDFLQLVIYKATTFSDQIEKIDTVRAYHSGPSYFVEVDIVMPGDTPLWRAHDLSQEMQDKLETLPGVERAFVHVDHETSHAPEHRKVAGMPQNHSVSGDETDDKRGGGKSKAGPACPFSHSAAEPGQHKQVCAWFVKGSCKFAHKCALAHVLPGQPMSMDRKNKKAAQQAGGSGSSSAQPAATAAGGSAVAQGNGGGGGSSGAGPSGSGGEENREGVRATSRRGDGSGGDRDRPHRDRPPRERSHRSRENGDRNGRGGGSRGDHPLASSTATLRPPIHIGKAPTISAAVTAPAVTSTTSFVAHSDEVDPEKDRATASLEQLQAHSHVRQSTITQDSVALSDYSKTPSATTAPLPPQVPSSPKTEMIAPGSGSSARRSVPLPTSSPRISTHLHHSHVPREPDFGPIGSPSRADLGPVGSPPRSAGAGGVRNDYGPIGSPPKASYNFSAVTNSGVGALSSLLAGLRTGADPNPPQHHSPQNQTSPARREGLPSSQTSQSNLHLNAATNAFGTSPFSAPGSKGLYMPFTDSASSSVTSQSNMHANLSGGVESNIPGYPASFAGSRAFGWGTGGPRRPSLPGHNQRPSLTALSSAGVLDESALEEEEGDGEEFLPSSLNDLLTKEERERRYSRTGGRPRGEIMGGRGGPTESVFEERDEPVAWNQTARRLPQNDNHQGQTNDLFSRSVPATSLLGNVRQLWQNDAETSSGGLHTSNDMSNLPQRTGLARALSSNPTMPYHTEEPMPSTSDNYGPASSSMLASSLASNASNAFLRSSRAGAGVNDGVVSYGGGDVGVMRFDVGQGLASTNDMQLGGIAASYNPQSAMFQHQHQQQQSQQSSQRISQSQIHQQRSSLSGLTSTLMQTTQSQNQSNSSAVNNNNNPYPMYSGPADTNSTGFSYSHQHQQHTAPAIQPHRQPLGPNPTNAQGANATGPGTGLRHEPGQSLPRGLGAGLSRIHLVPAMGVSLSSGVGSPASPSFVASPPNHGFGTLRNGLTSTGSSNSGFMSPGYASGWPAPGTDTLNPNGDKLALGATPMRNFGSGLTARMTTLGVTSNLNNSRPLNDLQLSRSPLNVTGPRSAGPIWGNGPGGMSGNMLGNPPSDVEVDDGTLFSMD
ncbi:hypothetical protein FRB97_008355 [Tulasnella sp. 331]|nr:hypothetical protein FRB97_008355 [Tulasnella sp. 331]